MDEGAIRESLDRVLASPGFANADRASRCLRYLVDEALAGRQDAIKEYTIGVEIYGRKPDYDPKIDSIVRVEASRLRAKLKQYYEGPGREDPVRIDLPRGGYVPVFQNGGAPATPARSGRHPVLYAAAGLALVALLSLAAVRLLPSKADQNFSLAIEPLANLSGDPETGRVAAAVTQQLNNRLAAVDGFAVLTDVNRARARLQGAVQRTGDRTRVLLRLVRARDGYEAWTGTYDSLPGGEARFADMLCALATRTLRVEFAGTPSRLAGEPALPADAMSLYIKAREFWNTQRRPGVEESITLFHHAIALSPNYAKAYEGLAASELYLTNLDPGHAAEHLARAREAAVHAIRLDDRLPDAHARLGNIYLYNDWKFSDAEHELGRAVVLKPGRTEVSRWYSLAARLRGHAGDARRELEFGAIANSAGEEIFTELGMLELDTGNTAAAWQMARAALAIAPLYRPAQILAGMLYEQSGDLKSAAGEFSSCSSAANNGLVCQAGLAHVQARGGQSKEALRTAAGLREHYLAALVHLGLGERDRALQDLEQSLAARESELPFVTLDPRFRPLRDDPRFKQVMQRIGL